MEKQLTIETSLPTKKSDSLLNCVLALDFDKDSDEESLVIDPDDFSGDENTQPGSPGNVGADENVPQDIRKPANASPNNVSHTMPPSPPLLVTPSITGPSTHSYNNVSMDNACVKSYKESTQHQFQKIRALNDNSSAVGWLTFFYPEQLQDVDIPAK